MILETIGCFFFILIVVVILSCRNIESMKFFDDSEDIFTAPTVMPDGDDYNWIYYPFMDVYLIDYNDLDFTRAYDTWMYETYYDFYNNYYRLPRRYTFGGDPRWGWNFSHQRSERPYNIKTHGPIKTFRHPSVTSVSGVAREGKMGVAREGRHSRNRRR